MGKTNISWTKSKNADGTFSQGETWNPTFGCSRVSAGCTNCYAEALALRFGYSKKPWTKPNAAENVVIHRDRFEAPLRWRKPRRVFVNSMSDLFHELIPDSVLEELFEIMRIASQHEFLILTKRPERMAAFVMARYTDRQPLPPNCWLGTSIEENRWVTRADIIRELPCAVRFLSCEPLLEALPDLNLAGISWVICGGESGPQFRPMDLEWARQLRDRCIAEGIAFWYKQSASRLPESGKTLDGRLWEEYPDTPLARPPFLGSLSSVSGTTTQTILPLG